MRSDGQVRFITVSSRVQMSIAGTVAAVALVWVGSMGVMAFAQLRSNYEASNLLDREAMVAKSEHRIEAYSADLAKTTADLEKRQDLIEDLTAMLPAQLLSEGEEDTVSDSSAESEKLISMLRESFPEAENLARIEARQIAFVENLTRFADRRARRAEQAIRQLGLNPQAIMSDNQEAMGGPLENLFGNDDGLDPRFERLGLSLARMNALERGLDTIPQVMPADEGSISSGFGYRSDPFRRTGAMHSGLDFRAPYGSPIRAAAAGTVSKVGWQSGYGKTVEITHGSGMITRYAHMSRWSTKAGDVVAAGDLIGAIGSTGRSTGPHLHFEVRINNRAVNPRPFLETASHVLKKARSEINPAPSASTNEQ